MRRHTALSRLLFATLLSAACHSEQPVAPDLGMPDLGTGELPDLSGLDLSPRPDGPAAGDLAMSGGDLAHAYTCRGDDAPGSLYKQATSSLKLPTLASSYSIDLNGDGRADNQLKNIITALAVAGLSPQSEIDQAVADGTLVYLAGITTTDLMDGSCVGVILHPAKPHGTGDPLPRYDGSDTFSKDAGPDTALIGQLSGGVLSTVAPPSLTADKEARLDLKLSVLGMAVSLPLRGVHVEGTLAMVGGKLVIQSGQIHGAVAQKDVDGTLVPAVATLLTKMINSDPASSTTKTLINLFENLSNPVSAMKCMVAADCCHTSPTTCVIQPAEVKASAIGGLLSSDIHAFNDRDEWAPAATGAKNGLSVGIGFSGVTAMY